jgi:site-specific recombinase XerD
MASHSLLHRASKPSLVLVPQSKQQIRRIFNNDQIIEKFGQWLLICGKAKNTRASYTLAAKQLGKFLVNKPLTAMTKEDVRGFIGFLYTKGFAASTMQVRLDALRCLGDCLQLGGQARASVPRYLFRRKLPKRLPPVKSEKEIRRLIRATRTPRDLAIMELGYASGLRVDELANLYVEDVNLRARSLIVREGKGGEDRIALFGKPAAVALRDYLGNRTSGRLFLQHPRRQRGGVFRDPSAGWWGQWRELDDTGKRVMRNIRLGDYDIPNKERARIALKAYLAGRLPVREPDKKPLGKKGIYRVIVAAAKRAGITGVHPHVLRHSCATHCLNHGMDIRHVQELLGHTSLIATQQYLHLATANLQKTHAKFFPR